ncbi:GNAT family N-acetyltransferase [Micromonospora sp. HM5-17]|uniref:GNAT family N-acetyltransferase n=1 Tax=Micromonospora sp. HM5-17 TaxID=2487710 RepID=UPI000F460D12|nr:GNAT family N-acetyltransferase [Micromonospora sp. HM5-17]ROT32194.1 GNAT family N-acetyltransferase [Micromonospora sp. HM5-17]
MLGRRDVGQRVVVRRIIGDAADRPRYTDALGELVELTETHLTLVTRDGPLRVPLAEVHRAKRVPPARRPGAAAVVELERAADEAWPAPVRGRLGDWLLRAAEGWTGRANSALPVGDPDRPLPEAIDAIRRWYAEQGQPALVNVPLPLATPVGVALDDQGWGRRPPVLVQTAPLATILAATPERPDLPAVELATTPSAGWLALVAKRKGRQASERGEEADGSALPAAAYHVLTAVDQVRFAHVYAEPAPPDGGRELLAIARGTVTGQGRWLGLTLLEVVPAARRRGLARHVVRALALWAAQQGATDAFLQVEEHNEAAVTLYRRLGFTTHHTYQTRTEPSD